MTFNHFERKDNEQKKFVEAPNDKAAVLTQATGPAASDSLYESAAIAIGASVTDYDATVTGSMFGTVTNSNYTIVRNNDAANAITVKLNSSTNDGFSIPAAQSLTIPNVYTVTNIFVTTIAGQTGTTEIVLFGS
ncbi:MAG: hypothetical protein ACTSU7_00340 [Candidatus Heimdallarchaeaceae archaeon]